MNTAIITKNIQRLIALLSRPDVDVTWSTYDSADAVISELKELYDTVVDEIYRLREVKQETLEHNAKRHTKRQRVKEMEKFLKNKGSGIAEYGDKLVRKLVEQVTVHDKRLVIRFKSGMEVEVGL